MSILVGATSACAGAAGQGAAGFTIDQSLRFRSGQLLTNTRSSAPTAASTNKYCFSMWVKLAGTNTSTHAVIAAGSRTSSQMQTNTAGDNQMQWIPSSHSGGSTLTTTAEFRDPSAWYHLHCKYDPADTSTSGIYINGDLVSTTPSNVSTDGSSNTWLANSAIITIGFIQATINQTFAEKPFEGYIAECHFVDGQALDPTDFAEYNDDEVWVPIQYTGTHGNNGFHLTFDSSQTNGIGHDSSGNGNNFTASGFETTAISSSNFDNDIDYEDTPTSNYATYNSLATARTSVGGTEAVRASETHEGNLHIDSAGQVWGTSNIAVESGKWYFEVESNMGDGYIGIHNNPFNSVSNLYYQTPKLYAYTNSGSGRTVGPVFATNITTGLTQYVSGDIIGVAVDIDAGELYFSVNGTWENSADPAAGTNPPINVTLTGDSWTFGGGSDQTVNFGQRDFIYTPPTGFSALQTNNLPEPTIKDGRDYFDALLYTGNDTARSITGLQFQPDLVWIKKRSNEIETHRLTDVARGTGVTVGSDFNGPENSNSDRLTAFNSDGFSLGTETGVNKASRNYVAWCWKAGGAPTADNTAGAGNTPTSGSVKIDDADLTSALAGSIAATRLSANTEAGFSIVRWTGNATQNATVAHGLTKAPEMIFIKNLDDTQDWITYTTVADGSLDFANLNGSNAWGNTSGQNSPTTSVFSLFDDNGSNGSGDDMIGYCWHSVDNYCKIGSYEGNNNTDGTFVYLGFKPSLIIFRNRDASGSWVMYDAARNTDNPVDTRLTANSNSTEGTSASMHVDFLSNGFKHRNNDQDLNTSHTFVYMAWAQHPFGGENAPPATAR